jgi:hypothetical protein
VARRAAFGAGEPKVIHRQGMRPRTIAIYRDWDGTKGFPRGPELSPTGLARAGKIAIFAVSAMVMLRYFDVSMSDIS